MKLGIIGLGLIGGSLGLALRSRHHFVIGISRQEQTCHIAEQKGIVDKASMELSAVMQAEVVFICTPLGSIVPLVEQLQPLLSPETILTDVGSVKTPIVEAVTPLWSNFIGGHPMAGTAQQGIHAVQSELFAGTPYVLTPTADTPLAAQETVSQLVASLNTEVTICSPQVHDQAVAWISHLPVFVSSALIAACDKETSEVRHVAQILASSGFRDTSRVGGGNPELGQMMAQYNKQALLRSLQIYREQVDEMITAIEQDNWDQVMAHLEQTQTARSHWVN